MSTTERRPNPFLSGNLAPVDTETTAFDLPITGTLPAELDGRYLRNGPNPIGEIDLATHHWFSGDGMVHGIWLEDGKARKYQNRYVQTLGLTLEREAGRALFPTMGAPKQLHPRMLAARELIKNAANKVHY